MTQCDYSEQHVHYQLIERAIHYLCEHVSEQPELSVLSDYLGVSEHHLQRIFSRWVGVSPKRFTQFLTKEYAKQALARSRSNLDTALAIGLSGPGRLHDLMVSCEAMTPGELKSLDLVISYGYGVSPFGCTYIAWTERGICHLIFCDQPNRDDEQELFDRWKGASFEQNNPSAQDYIDRVFVNSTSEKPSSEKPLHLLLQGTNFQLKVWEALIAVGEGELTSYSQLAERVGSPKASRAVGTAVASNKIGFLIPCHRVIRETGEIGNYRWGAKRKAAIQGWEAARLNKAGGAV
jgi:AraC family transcriptional regulator of adaptative response/methylated-DNA-[protein]-cysteine methyltransferase